MTELEYAERKSARIAALERVYEAAQAWANQPMERDTVAESALRTAVAALESGGTSALREGKPR